MPNLEGESQSFFEMTHFHIVLKVPAMFQKPQLCINIHVIKEISYYDLRVCHVLLNPKKHF